MKLETNLPYWNGELGTIPTIILGDVPYTPHGGEQLMLAKYRSDYSDKSGAQMMGLIAVSSPFVVMGVLQGLEMAPALKRASSNIKQRVDFRKDPHQHIIDPPEGEYLTPENLDLSEMTEFEQYKIREFIRGRINLSNPASAREIEIYIREMVFNGYFDDPFLPRNADQWHQADISLQRQCGAGWYGE